MTDKNVQKHEPASPAEAPTTTYPSTPLMGGPSKEDKQNLENYPLTPEKSTSGKSHGSYNLVESNKKPEKKMSTRLKFLLASLCFCFLIVLLLIGVWLAFHVGEGSRVGHCDGDGCNVTASAWNDTGSPNTDFEYEESFADFSHAELRGPINLPSGLVTFETSSLDCASKYTEKDQANYNEYILQSGKTFSDEQSKCESLERFFNSKGQIDSLNKKFKPNAEFGLTVFTDWTELQRSETGTGSISSDDFKEKSLRISKAVDNTYVNYLENTYNVVFNDLCSPKLNIKKALKTIAENIANNITSKQPTAVDQKDCGDDEGVYQIALDSQGGTEDDRENFTSWLLTRGPFATNLIVTDSFFDYKNGTFNSEMCAENFTTVLHVLVVGNGKRYDALTGSDVQFWHIMPVGEIWKNWGNGGYMRLDVNACMPPRRAGMLIAYLD